jgi:small conductance mechanosensitive channel
MLEQLLGNVDTAALVQGAIDFAIHGAGALAFLVVSWMVAAWVGRTVRRGFIKASVDDTLGIFLSNAARWAILIMAMLAALGMFGIQTTSFAAVIGAAGLAVGLAFQGTLSNIASGVMLLIFRPFKVDDVINAAGVTGKVIEIGLFTTSFDTLDNRRIFVPNALIFGGTIENVTYHDKRRVDVSVGTDYGADLDEVRTVLERSIVSVDGILDEPESQIYLLELGASSIDWAVRVWCRTEDYWEVREAVTRAIKVELDTAGIGIPFPQMDVHVDGALRGNS